MKKELFGHPIGLGVLFLTEMWERFCFYGMRGLLALYVAKHLSTPAVAAHVPGYFALRAALTSVFGPLDDEQHADHIYGLYTAFVYLTPFFGGIVADRLLGQRRSVVIGGLVMAAGNFMLMKEELFYPALLVLIVGNGFFKSNISTQVGYLYPKGDERRDRAFNIFYVGINLGAWLSPFVCGTLGQKLGWSWGFGAAGVGMLVGLAIYLGGQRYLAPDRMMREKEHVTTVEPFTREEWAKIIALVVLCALNISFWGVYEQQGNSLQFWADKSTDLHVLRPLGHLAERLGLPGVAGALVAWEMPSTWFQSVNPAFIFFLTPFINRLWLRQARKKTEPSSVTKMAIGCFLLGISFLVMIGAGRIVESGQRAGFGWLVCCSFLLTLGEIYLSPVGLSLVTKLSPPRIVSMMMGMWFLSSFFGNYLSGYLATYANKISSTSFFTMLSGISIVTGIVMVMLFSPLKKAIGDENAA